MNGWTDEFCAQEHFCNGHLIIEVLGEGGEGDNEKRKWVKSKMNECGREEVFQCFLCFLMTANK
jgi:hypothetical protein